MTSKIKVDNIENQCGGAVVTKCGGTTTITGSVVKSNTLQASDAGNIISQSGTTITLGATGDNIVLAGGASQSGFGRTGTVDWQTTPKTTGTFTAVSGEGYFLNTSGGVITANLPAGVAGAIVSFADYAATWQTSNVTVVPNGTDKIGSVSANVVLNLVGQSVTFVFVDSTQGWINTMDSTSNVRGSSFLAATVSGACNTLVTAPCCANTKIATFTGPGDFTVTAAALCAAQNIVSHLIVAGGGSGGTGCSGGGAGGGGFREVKNPITPYTASPLDGYSTPANRITVTAQAYPIVIGGGGTGQGVLPNSCNSDGNRGSNSSFGGIISTGGGGGGDGPGTSPTSPGGSGGGGGHSGGTSGTGNTPPVSPAQGQPGRQSEPSTGPAPSDAGGAGGGATVAGTPGSTGHQGGAGATTSISATPTAYAGGGGGSNRCGGTSGDVAGGAGGGGRGASNPRPRPATDATGQNGTANTGGGGGAGGSLASGGPIGGTGTGGSGIVIIRYKFQ